MKASTILSVFFMIVLVGCNSEPTKQIDESVNEEDTARIAEWEASLTEKSNAENVSQEMTDFMYHIDGKQESIVHALDRYAANDEVKNHDIAYYEQTEPKIVKVEGNCYFLKCKSEEVVNNYTICWEEGKITSITTGEVENW